MITTFTYDNSKDNKTGKQKPLARNGFCLRAQLEIEFGENRKNLDPADYETIVNLALQLREIADKYNGEEA